MIQPPKMSPLGLQSAGIARVRDASSPLGSLEFRRRSLERIPSISRLRISAVNVAPQHSLVNVYERMGIFSAALQRNLAALLHAAPLIYNATR